MTSRSANGWANSERDAATCSGTDPEPTVAEPLCSDITNPIDVGADMGLAHQLVGSVSFALGIGPWGKYLNVRLTLSGGTYANRVSTRPIRPTTSGGGKPDAAEQAQTAATPTGETRTALVRRARRIGRELALTYPDAHCELNFDNPLQLVIATILSAQCTDVRVNLVTPALFAKYPDAASLAAADRAELETMIQSTGFFRAKANSLLGMANAICERYGGEVPRRMKDLVTLPGVGRKTANVVLGNAFDVPGITVDTHFGRLSRRFGWTDQIDPEKVEVEVGSLFPRKDWTMLSHELIFHGRRCCFARRPACGACTVAKWCPSYGEGPTDPKVAAKMIKTGVA